GLPRAAGAPVPGPGTPHPAVARGDVPGGHGLELLHAAYDFVSYATDDARHGGGDHRPLLDDARTVVVSCAAAPLGTPEAARASFAGISTPDQVLVFVTTVKCGATQISRKTSIMVKNVQRGSSKPVSGAIFGRNRKSVNC